MRATFLCAFLLAGQLPAAAQPAPGPDSVSVSAFVSELDALTTALSNASPADAAGLTANVPLRWRVNTGANGIVVVDGTWVIHAVRDAAAAPAEWPERRKQIAARLAEIRAHAADRADAGALTATRGKARAAVGTVLARREFQPSGQSWLGALQQQIAGWFRALLERLGASGLATRQSAIVLAWIAAAAAFAGLGIWLARVLDKPRHGATLALARRLPPRVSAREWGSRSRAALRTRDVREAIRCAYNAALRRVEEEGGWRVDPARTPREYLPLLRANDSRRAPVMTLTEQFEQVWYGNRAVSDDDSRSLLASLEKLGCAPAGE